MDVSIEGTLIERMGMEIISADPDRVVATMPVEGNTQPFGYLHGGATAALCETVASIGAALAAGAERSAFGVEISVNHLRTVRDGEVRAVATPLHRGRTMTVWDVSVTNGGSEVVAVSRVTLAIRDRR